MLPFTPAADVPDQPTATLRHWRVYVMHTGERFLAGQVVETGRARVTTPVATLDVRDLRATTSSGRMYRLEGEPDASGTAEYVWSWWALLNSWSAWRDVTDELWAAHVRDQVLH
jgi:hypothetical protein